MFSFKIKADSTDIEVPAARALLFFAAFIITVSGNNSTYIFNNITAALFIISAFITEIIIVKYRINILMLAAVAAILLACCTFNILFPLTLLAVAFLVKKLYTPPVVKVSESSISIKKTFLRKEYEWPLFNRVVLKDGVLTLDFKSNKVIQLETENPADEAIFNSFSAARITE